jgi:hypothetical protein
MGQEKAAGPHTIRKEIKKILQEFVFEVITDL